MPVCDTAVETLARKIKDCNARIQTKEPLTSRETNGRPHECYVFIIYLLFHLFHVVTHKDRAMPRLCWSLSALAVSPVIVVHVISSPHLQLALLSPPAKSTAVTSKVLWPECSRGLTDLVVPGCIKRTKRLLHIISSKHSQKNTIIQFPYVNLV